jgi:flavodoxin
MKTLIVYYSRTGKTRSAAQEMAKILDADLEAIFDTTPRGGLMGYLRSGLEGMMRWKASISPPSNDPREYDLLIIGTPLWAGRMSSPVRAYLHRFHSGLPPVALVCTASGGSAEDAATDLERTFTIEPLAAICLSEEEADDPRTVVNLRIFIDDVRKRMKRQVGRNGSGSASPDEKRF